MDQSQIANLKSQIESLRPWVEAETGMDFSGNRFSRLCDAVQKVSAQHHVVPQLDRLLTGSPERGLFLERLTAELTVGESFFFRNEHHFCALRDHVLPEVLGDNAAKREVRVWSAGCAGGEEPYSLAILFDQVLKSPIEDRKSKIENRESGWRVSILGTDLNPDFLARARQGRFRPWSFRHTNIQDNRIYFSPAQDEFQLVENVRDTVRFAYLNLVKDAYPSPLTGTLGLDLILFRNVAIYLKPDVTRSIIQRFHQALRPGGWLLLGETEVSLAPTEGFEVRRFDQATIYQKARTAEPPSDATALPMPVLANFVAQPTTGAAPSLPSLSLPTVPALPDWVPLPKSKSAGPALTQKNAGDAGLRQVERLLAERQLDEAERAIQRISDRKQRARSQLMLARAFLAGAESSQARRMLEQCLGDEPLLTEAQLMHASLAEEAGDLVQAEQSYRRALYVDRNCPMAHFHLALVQQQKGDAAGAERSLKTTLKLIENKDPHALVEYGEGVCYGRLKEMAEVILDF